jgi:hypothetical protein
VSNKFCEHKARATTIDQTLPVVDRKTLPASGYCDDKWRWVKTKARTREQEVAAKVTGYIDERKQRLFARINRSIGQHTQISHTTEIVFTVGQNGDI